MVVWSRPVGVDSARRIDWIVDILFVLDSPSDNDDDSTCPLDPV